MASGPITSQKSHPFRQVSSVYLVTVTALVLFFLFDGINKVLSTYSFPFSRASIFIRVIYELLFLALIFSHLNTFRAKLLSIIVFLFATFMVGQLLILLNSEYRYSITESIITFNKYLFVFIIYGAIYQLKYDEARLMKCIAVLETVFVVNSIAIFVGLLTGLEFLKTYVHVDYRHGYMGLIPAQNEATLFYFIAISLTYYKRFILKAKSIKFFVILGAALLLGTKGIYVFIALLLLFHLTFYTRRRIWLIAALSFLFLKLLEFAQSAQGKALLTYFYNQKNKLEWLSMMLSGRDTLVKKNLTAQIDHWTWINYLTGGQDVSRFTTEMDFFDLFLFLGVVGGSIYLFLFFQTLFTFRITIFTIFFVGCYFALAFAGGHFFFSALNGVYLCLTSLFIHNTQRPDAATTKPISE